MIKYVTPRQSTTSLAIAFSSAIAVAPLEYPKRIDPYVVFQSGSTHSDFPGAVGRLSRIEGEAFMKNIAEIYDSFSERQRRLGAEFETAIFSDLESLYEA